MAGKDGKNEKPTQKRLRDAKTEGQTPKSAEASSMLVMAAAVTTLVIIAPGALVTTGRMMQEWLGSAGEDVGLRGDALVHSTTEIAMAWAPALVAAIAAGVIVNVSQGGVVLAPKTSRPSLKALSPKRGLSQLSPKQAGYTLVRNVLKFVIVGMALISPVRELWETIPTTAGLGPAIAVTGKAISTVVTRVIVGALLIGVLDQVVSRRKWKNKLMMSRQEVIDESKMTEGDPHTKAARRRAGMDMRRRRSLAPISMADVVVTNPTHFAVALAYTPGAVAPQVIAKGTERAAKKIRKEANKHGVPIIENKPLARALYRQVRVGNCVPERFFDDVVKVLVAAYWRRGRVPRHVTQPAPTVTPGVPTTGTNMNTNTTRNTNPGEAA